MIDHPASSCAHNIPTHTVLLEAWYLLQQGKRNDQLCLLLIPTFDDGHTSMLNEGLHQCNMLAVTPCNAHWKCSD